MSDLPLRFPMISVGPAPSRCAAHRQLLAIGRSSLGAQVCGA